MALLRSRGLAAGIERTVRSRPLQLLARDVRSGRIAASRSSVLASCVVGAQSRKAQFESKRWFSAASDSAPASATSQLKADSCTQHAPAFALRHGVVSAAVRITNSVSGRKELLEDDGAGAITWYRFLPLHCISNGDPLQVLVRSHRVRSRPPRSCAVRFSSARSACANTAPCRTYVCMDIAHRILTDVFGRSVVLAMVPALAAAARGSISPCVSRAGCDGHR